MVCEIPFILIIYRPKYQTVILFFSSFEAEKHKPCMEILKKCQRAGPLERLVVIEKHFKSINAAVLNMV